MWPKNCSNTEKIKQHFNLQRNLTENNESSQHTTFQLFC